MLACLLVLAAAVPARAQSPAEVARAVDSNVVWVHPQAQDRLSEVQAGRVRLRILAKAFGRMKVAVVPPSLTRKWGGIGEFADEVDNTLDVRGAFVIVAGSDYYVVTSYANSGAAAIALRRAVRSSRKLVDQLLAAVPALAKADPGRGADLAERAPPGINVPDFDVPETGDFFDDVEEAFKLGVLVVAGAIALPFVIFAIVLVLRFRRRRRAEEEAHHIGEKTVRDELVELGDGIRALDIDTSMPNADRMGMAEYEQAIARYDQANDLLLGDPSGVKVDQAKAAIAAGHRHLASAKARLEAKA